MVPLLGLYEDKATVSVAPFEYVSKRVVVDMHVTTVAADLHDVSQTSSKGVILSQIHSPVELETSPL